MLSPTQGFLNQASPLHTLSGTQTQAPQGSRKYFDRFLPHTGVYLFLFTEKKVHDIYMYTYVRRPQSCSGDKELALPMAGSPDGVGSHCSESKREVTASSAPPCPPPSLGAGLSRSRRPLVHGWRPQQRPGCPPGLSASHGSARRWPSGSAFPASPASWLRLS